MPKPPGDAGVRLKRLLAIIPWLAQRGSAPLREVAERFGLTEAEVERELELAAMCGLPPYTPDSLVELIVADGEVSARIPDYFRRPAQLTAADGFAVVAAGRALLAIPGADTSGPLATAIAKVEEALGGSRGVTVQLDTPPFLDELRDAAADGMQLEVEYYSASRDAASTRAIDPYRVFSEAGRWYVEAHCHTTGRVNTFRVDRIRSARPTGDRFEVPVGVTDDASVFHPGPDTEVVVIDLPASARWVVDSYPTEKVEAQAGGRLRVTMAIGGSAFLDRLLLRVGADATVVSPVEQQAAGVAVAERVLDRYATSSR